DRRVAVAEDVDHVAVASVAGIEVEHTGQAVAQAGQRGQRVHDHRVVARVALDRGGAASGLDRHRVVAGAEAQERRAGHRRVDSAARAAWTVGPSASKSMPAVVWPPKLSVKRPSVAFVMVTT